MKYDSYYHLEVVGLTGVNLSQICLSLSLLEPKVSIPLVPYSLHLDDCQISPLAPPNN